MIKSGRLDRRYNGIIDCFRRTMTEEGNMALWRGNTANVLRYFPTQAFNFAFKDKYKQMFGFDKMRDGFGLWMLGNIGSGAVSTYMMRNIADSITANGNLDRRPVLRAPSLYTHSTTHEPGLPTMPRTRAASASLAAWWTSIARH